MRFLDGPRPRLFAHRGASRDAPENTIEAFELAVREGAERLEMDVHATSDGQVVVFHDAELDRTTSGTGPVRSRSFEEVRALDAGAHAAGWAGRGIRVPTLDEVLARFPGVPVNVEIKQEEPPIVQLVLDVLDRHAARERTLLAAEEHSIMERIRASAPDVLTSFSAAEVGDFVFRLRDGRLGDPAGGADAWRPAGVALQVPPSFGSVDIVTPASVAAAHGAGVEVHVWTIDEVPEMERLLDLGVDAIITNVPAVALDLYRRRGLR